LAALARAFTEHEELRLLLLHPAVPAAAKNKLAAKFIAEEVTRDFFALLIARGRVPLVPLIHREYERIYRQYAGVVAAVVTTAVAAPHDFLKELTGVLRMLTGKKVEVEARVDPDVIGGVRLAVGDHLFDGTLATRLARMREFMKGTGV